MSSPGECSDEDMALNQGQRGHGLSEASRARHAILEGYRDIIAGRTVVYEGNLRKLMREQRQRDS